MAKTLDDNFKLWVGDVKVMKTRKDESTELLLKRNTKALSINVSICDCLHLAELRSLPTRRRQRRHGPAQRCPELPRIPRREPRGEFLLEALEVCLLC